MFNAKDNCSSFECEEWSVIIIFINLPLDYGIRIKLEKCLMNIVYDLTFTRPRDSFDATCSCIN